MITNTTHGTFAALERQELQVHVRNTRAHTQTHTHRDWPACTCTT
jgi:hypothetical protein